MLKRPLSYGVLLTAMILVAGPSFGQDLDYDSLLQRVDTVENPVFKPVLSASYGVLNFRGDVKNSLLTSATGHGAFMFNVATFIDKKNHYYVANFNFLSGTLGGNQYSFEDPEQNLNFETSIYSFGLNVEYRFGHIIKEAFFVRPYISLGIESISFGSKGDLYDANGVEYQYWTDGTIRDQPEGTAGANILYRDYSYETDLRKRDNANYNQRSLAIPATFGLHFLINSRSFFSLGVSYHYTLSDYLDNVAYEGTPVQGKKGNDSYVYSHLSLHFDLFSDPSTRTVDLMYADVDFDPLFFDDEDGDFVLDVVDQCPGTPYGVDVDSLGCPLDGDLDGVPDYRDNELDTAPGNWVNDEGVTVNEEDFYASIANRDSAMPREDLAVYMETIREDYRLGSDAEIPEKFLSLDEDEDGYISFDELMKTVDLYFDFKLDLNLGELRELNQFFFSQ